MAKFLQQLLEVQEPMFSMGLRRLEAMSGHSGVDVRLIADITHRAHDVMRALRLDPSNTTARELYNALSAAVVSDNFHDMLSDSDFVLVSIDDEVISFNMIDVIENSHHELTFEKRIISHGQRSLRGELLTRYLEHVLTDNISVQAAANDAGIVVASDEGYSNVASATQLVQASRSSAPSVLSIGDIFTDAFIKLREDKARIDTDPDGSKRLSLPFGSKPPYDSVEIVQAVGPSPNAAVAFSRLGLRSSLMAFLGDDQPGKESLEYLKSELVSTDSVSVEEGQKSNYYYVLRYGADRTILVKNEEYSYTWREPAQVPDWIYLSLISDKAWPLHEDLLRYLEAHPSVKLAFQPGTFHFEWGKEKLKDLYGRSEVVVMNREEAVDVTGVSYDSVKELLGALRALGPKIVVMTDGPNGSYAHYEDTFVTVPNYPDPAPPYDRTGAGDAFASTFVAAVALGETVENALTWSPINSMSVVQKLGAQAGLLSAEKIREYLASAPDDYHPKELTE
ncbi:MAG: putative Ribokinase [Candidatus Saccharibacteria bacterium]|nr:putative Ribokinase [Candidatus Saccharibacteria bacterium]